MEEEDRDPEWTPKVEASIGGHNLYSVAEAMAAAHPLEWGQAEIEAREKMDDLMPDSALRVISAFIVGPEMISASPGKTMAGMPPSLRRQAMVATKNILWTLSSKMPESQGEVYILVQYWIRKLDKAFPAEMRHDDPAEELDQVSCLKAVWDDLSVLVTIEKAKKLAGDQPWALCRG